MALLCTPDNSTNLGLPLGDNPVKLFGLLLHGGVEDLGLVQHHSHLVCRQKGLSETSGGSFRQTNIVS